MKKKRKKEKKRGKCHLYAHTDNRTVNGTNGYDQRRQRTKTKESSSLFSKREQPMGPMVIIREHNRENRGKCHLYALTEQRPMEPMVMIREHTEEEEEEEEEEEGKCHLYAHRDKRTVNGTNGYYQRTQRRKPSNVSSLCPYRKQNSQWNQWL